MNTYKIYIAKNDYSEYFYLGAYNLQEAERRALLELGYTSHKNYAAGYENEKILGATPSEQLKGLGYTVTEEVE